MQMIDVDSTKKIETKSPPKAFKLFVFISAAAIVIALIIIATVDPKYLPW